MAVISPASRDFVSILFFVLFCRHGFAWSVDCTEHLFLVTLTARRVGDAASQTAGRLKLKLKLRRVKAERVEEACFLFKHGMDVSPSFIHLELTCGAVDIDISCLHTAELEVSHCFYRLWKSAQISIAEFPDQRAS